MMNSRERTQAEKAFHDFMLERKWLVDMVGYGPSTSKLYSLYIFFILVFHYGNLGMNVYGIVMTFGNRAHMVNALHLLVVVIFNLWAINTRIFADKALKKARKCIESGVYLYEGEELLEEQVKIKESVVQDIRSKSSDFVAVWCSAAMTICVLFPIIQMLTVTKEEYEAVVDIANPYLPAFFYLPFNTRSILGFVSAYIIALIFHFYTYGYGMIMNEFYISILLQLRAQLQILNHSIRHIHKRAILMYSRTKGIPNTDMLLEEIYQNSDYQNCLNKCLRSNIQHHQVLIRLNNDFFKYSGSLLIMVFILAANVFALSFYAAIQERSLNSSVKNFMNLVAEQVYVLYMCVFGEIIMDESSSLFKSIYSMPWFYYNKKFNKSLQMFMISTMKPMRVKTMILDLTASLEAYANFISAMYKILNVLKQSDVFQ